MPDFEALRSEFRCLRKTTYLNTGTLGPTPATVMEDYLADLRAWNDAGAGDPPVYIGRRDALEATRQALAAWLGTEVANLTLTQSVTESINIVLAGLTLPSDARILTTDEEHGALLAPLDRLRRKGGRVEEVTFGNGGGDLTKRLRSAMDGEPVRLVALSHVSSCTGAVADVAAIGQLCHKEGALLLVDGAQAAGQIPVDLGTWDVDFYALNGHKWMLAPVGCGGLFIRPEAAPLVEEVFTGDGPGYVQKVPGSVEASRPGDGRRFEIGTRNWPALAAWGRVMALWREIGEEACYERQRGLARELADLLAEVPGIAFFSPRVPETGMTTIALPGWDADRLLAALRKRGIVGRPVKFARGEAVRFSTAWFNNRRDVEAAAQAVQEIALGG